LRIDHERQASFAELSGDYNPLHVDADAARRSQFGRCVVHGIHLVLAALESLNLEGPNCLVSLDAQFRSAVLIGEAISFDAATTPDGTQQISVLVDRQVRAVISAHTSSIATLDRVKAAPAWQTEVAEFTDFDELATVAGREDLALDAALFGRLFPSLAKSLSATDAATLLATTRVIGMQCPGRHALFRRLTWQQAEAHDEPQVLDYHVASERRRFSMLTLALSAGNRQLEAETIVRDAPPQQASLDHVRRHIDASAFLGTRAVIIGGSRGLGELASKVFAAGSAEVLLTYRTGAQDAAAIAEQIGSQASIVQLDTNDQDPASIDRIRQFAPTHLSYFATPPIAKQSPKAWNHQAFERFIGVYVTALSGLLSMVDSCGSLDSLLFPSSTFIDDKTAGFAEYVAAKLAGERLCETWQDLRPHQRVIVERFPPLVTDQTAALLGSDAADNLATLIPVLQRVRATDATLRG